MGCYTPADITENQKKLLDKYNQHMSDIFQHLKPDFKGIFASNIIFTDNDIYTFELNMRPGITEFETLVEHMNCDILELFYNIAHGQVSKTKIKYKKGYTGCVVVVNKDIAKRKETLEKVSKKELFPDNIPENIKINYNFNTDRNNVIINKSNKIFSLIVTNKSKTFTNIYDYIKLIKYRDKYYRNDIGTEYEQR